MSNANAASLCAVVAVVITAIPSIIMARTPPGAVPGHIAAARPAPDGAARVMRADRGPSIGRTVRFQRVRP